MFEIVRNELLEGMRAQFTELQNDLLGVVDATVKGWGPIGKPKPLTKLGTKKLDADMSKVFANFLREGGRINEFFAVNADILGKRSDYDLREFSGFLSDLDQREIEKELAEWERSAPAKGSKQRLDDNWAKTLCRYILDGGTIAEFWSINEDLLGGKMSDFDLSEFA